jgi:hypothetical protein
MGDRNILVVGHSHIGAIRSAAIIRREADPGRPRARTIYLPDPMFGGEMAEGGKQFSPGVRAAILDQIERHNPIVASAIGGNAHSALALVPYRPFDFILSGEDALPIDHSVELRSEADVRAELTSIMARQLLQMRLLADLSGPFFHLESPPPVRSSAWVRDHAERFFTDQPAFAELGVAPAGVRYRTWRLACRIVREECERLGCHYVPVPKIMCGEAGLLRPSQARDATHAGPHFGEEMLRELERAATEN